MPNFNKVIIAGNLARDVELRQTQSGMSVASGAIAINESYKQHGEKRDMTTFADFTAFGKIAENLAHYFCKGDPILIEGRLRQEQWTDKQSGQTRTKLFVLVDRFEFLRGKSDAGANSAVQNNRTAESADDRYTPDEEEPF